MAEIDITTNSVQFPDGMLQTALPLDTTLQVVSDNVGNDSQLYLATNATRVAGTLQIRTDNAEYIDAEDMGTNNRFNVNRSGQQVNIDFASKPTDTTTVVGSIRTATNGTDLADVLKFQENGQVTFTERVKIESDSTVTTQTSSVIQASTTNANLALVPNGDGAIIANIPDGTTTGGNARGANAVDLQMIRSASNQVAGGVYDVIAGGRENRTINAPNGYCFIGGGRTNQIIFGGHSVITGGLSNTVNGGTASAYMVIGGGQSNTASANYATVSGGQANTASTNTHATVVGGSGNTASGQYSVAGGNGNTSSSTGTVAIGQNNVSSSQGDVSLGQNNTASGSRSFAGGYLSTSSIAYAFSFGYRAYSYLLGQFSLSSGAIGAQLGTSQQSNLTARKDDVSLVSAATTTLSLDGTGTTNLIIPNGSNRAWNVQVNWVAVVTAITGTATGISVGDVVTSVDLLGFKRVGGTSSASAHTSAATKTMVTTPAQYAACAIAYTAGGSQEMAMTFTGPTFVGGGSVTMRVVARVELSEVAW